MKKMTREDYDIWLKKLPPNVCTFCEWEKYQIVLKEFEHWVWIENIAPYWDYHTLIISKRHFEKYGDMTFKEAGELISVIDYGTKKIIDGKLKRKDGSLIEKVLYMWRDRFNRFDPISGTIRPAHFHLLLSPDRDHSFDPILDPEAHKCDMSKLK